MNFVPAGPPCCCSQFGAPRSGLGGALAPGVIQHRGTPPSPPPPSPQQLLQEEKVDPAVAAAGGGGGGGAASAAVAAASGGGGGGGDVGTSASRFTGMVGAFAMERLVGSLETVRGCLDDRERAARAWARGHAGCNTPTPRYADKLI